MAEDNGIDADVLVALLDATNFDARVVTSILDAELALATDDYDVLLLDQKARVHRSPERPNYRLTLSHELRDVP